MAEQQKYSAASTTAHLGIWTFLATEILLFGGLFTAYIVFRLQQPELFMLEHEKLDRLLGLTNTVILITSSLTMALAVAASRAAKIRRSRMFLAATALLAMLFLIIKYLEWSKELRHGLTPATNLFFSLYYSMTGLHGLHVLAGLTLLLWLTLQLGRSRGASASTVEITGLYWHFVDLVWIYLFPLLYLIR